MDSSIKKSSCLDDFLRFSCLLSLSAFDGHFDGEDLKLPKPSSPEQLLGDERFQDGFWLLIDIDTSKISPYQCQYVRVFGQTY